MIIYLYDYYYVLQYFFVFLFADNCQKTYMNVSTENLMMIIVAYKITCFSCKTVTSVHNNNSCKTITSVLNNKKCKFDM